MAVSLVCVGDEHTCRCYPNVSPLLPTVSRFLNLAQLHGGGTSVLGLRSHLRPPITRLL